MIVNKDLTVLLVEDDNFQRQMVARMLGAVGLNRIKEASNGQQALTMILGEAPIDIILCDLDMPRMDGMELIRHLGLAHSNVSVIITSAHDGSLLRSVDKMARAYGVTLLGVIEKPVTLKALANLIGLHEEPRREMVTVTSDEHHFSLDEILQAVQKKQFEPFFQPKIELATGRILGAEALARWHHPDHGFISPHAFISQLEQSGNIDALTLFMLEKAAIACRAWRKQGMGMSVSVNLSLVSMASPMLADMITDIIRNVGLDPGYMILEITESAAMTDVAPVLENLARLRMRGFGLSIDDYGSGYSSLQQLSRIPFSELKIDQSFVFDCSTNPCSKTIIESSVDMAHRLAIKSVAEGVESQDDWDLLKAAGCDSAQGFFIARPMQEKAFLNFCSTGANNFGHMLSGQANLFVVSNVEAAGSSEVVNR